MYLSLPSYKAANKLWPLSDTTNLVPYTLPQLCLSPKQMSFSTACCRFPTALLHCFQLLTDG